MTCRTDRYEVFVVVAAVEAPRYNMVCLQTMFFVTEVAFIITHYDSPLVVGCSKNRLDSGVWLEDFEEAVSV